MGVLQISRTAQTEQIAAVGLRAHGVDVSPKAYRPRGRRDLGCALVTRPGTDPRWGVVAVEEVGPEGRATTRARSLAALFAARKGYPVGEAVPLGEAARKFLRAVPSLMLLVVVIGGILKGWFTATEASAVAVLYALVLAFIYKELTWRKLPGILLQSAKTTAVVLLLVIFLVRMALGV